MKKDAYFQLVWHNHRLTYGRDLHLFLAEAIERIRANGYNAPACMVEIHDGIELAVRRAIPKGANPNASGTE